MKFTALCLATGLAATSAMSLSEYSEDARLFKEFVHDHAKVYASSEEEVLRFEIFVKNMVVVAERNAANIAAGGEAIHGVTRFSDMEQTEFEAMFLTADISMRSPRLGMTNATATVDASTFVDWAGKLTTPVKDQAQCGSCWAFSAIEQIESDVIRTLDTTIELSAQQVTACDPVSQGCRGGWTERAYEYVMDSAGLESWEDYPYTAGRGRTGQCSAGDSKAQVTISGYTTVYGEAAMAEYIQSTGPLSVCLDANTFNSYRGGVMMTCGTDVDHCVQAVGVLPDADTGYWKVRNSWGTSWGEDGYIRLAYDRNLCDITSDPTYVTGAALA